MKKLYEALESHELFIEKKEIPRSYAYEFAYKTKTKKYILHLFFKKEDPDFHWHAYQHYDRINQHHLFGDTDKQKETEKLPQWAKELVLLSIKEVHNQTRIRQLFI